MARTAIPRVFRSILCPVDFSNNSRGALRYAAMLAGASNNMLADANTVSLLSSYIFTPNTYVIFNPDGAATGSFMPMTPANVSPQLRLAFFQTASAILLRPQPPPDQDQSTSGIAGKYMVIKRLLPLFEFRCCRLTARLLQ